MSHRLLSLYLPVIVSHPRPRRGLHPLNVRYRDARRPNHSRLSCRNPRVSLAMSGIVAFQPTRRKECSSRQRATFTRSRGSPRSAFTRTLVAADNLQAKLGNSEFTEWRIFSSRGTRRRDALCFRVAGLGGVSCNDIVPTCLCVCAYVRVHERYIEWIRDE